ncbi:MAG: hypothetical protein IJM02_02950 [Clostridia bacterium]|nr:hypothetical protein [Clostridia bacterium]
MKLIKVSVSLFLAFILAVSAVSVAFAEGDNGEVVLSGTAGEGITWTLTGKGLLTVSGKGAIEDDIDYEYDDDGEISSWSKNGSIGMSINEYIDNLIADFDTEEAAETLLNTVTEIVVEEGITAIPEDEFGSLYPRKITLPSTLEEIGYNAINAMYAEELIIPSDKIDVFQFSIPAYRDGAEPFGSLDDAKNGYIEHRVNEEKFFEDIAPFNILGEVFGLQNGVYEYDEDEMSEALKNINEALGTDYDNLNDIAAAALDKVNEYFGTDYSAPGEVFYVSESEFGPEVCAAEDIQSMYDSKCDEIFNDDRYFAADFYEEPYEGRNLYDWLTVYGVKGSAIEKKCNEAGIKFAVAGSAGGTDLCKFCGRDHSGSFLQKILGAIHTVLYFFAHLFGLRP